MRAGHAGRVPARTTGEAGRMPAGTKGRAGQTPATAQAMWKLLVILVAAVALAGCGVPLDSQPRDIDDPRAQGSSGPLAADAGTAIVRLYLVRDARLVRIARRVPTAQPPSGQLRELLKGPSASESAAGLTTALSTMNVIDMTVVDRRAIVNIAEPTGQGARSDEVLAFGQIVCTLTSQGADVGTVSFVSDGRPLTVPRADGSLADGSLTLADYAGLLDS